jgi:uncharacterized protein (TIGR03086 family)
MTQTSPLTTLSRALDQAGDVVAAVRPDDLSRPTPCPQWDVGALVAHLMVDLRNYRGNATGEDDGYDPTPDPLGSDVAADFRAGADDLLHAWHQAEGTTVTSAIPFQAAEFAVHAWDLNAALGGPVRLDPEVGETALATMQAALRPEHRGDRNGMTFFAEEVAVPADRPVYDRLAGFAGRDPSWAPPVGSAR